MTKTILSYYSFSKEQEKELKEIAPDYTFVSSLSEADKLSDIEAIYGWNKEDGPIIVQDDSSQLKWLQIDSAGVDYLDLETMQEKGIVLTNASGIHAHPIAESVIGMLLSYTRGIRHSIKMQDKAEWNTDTPMSELTDKTMLIVGTGQIGKQTGKLAKAFDMHTIGINRSGRDVEYMDEQYTQENLAEALPKADVVVNILPSTDETKDLFDYDLFEKMKDSAVYINVGRGTTVVTDDLIKALDNGQIAFAALDVVHEEPLPSDHPLYAREDVLLTPHISGDFDRYAERLYPIFKENLKAFVAGEDLPRNVVDYDSGY
ncbi:phosphoglycerate dehydrogenase [Alkalibacterium iburiense]|uniref:Phosphoglycerate dehydrogenase n=1 Tax=Alkalibacterium iburiense TaxID=290589 RepID=A0ABN0XB20_9LACT